MHLICSLQESISGESSFTTTTTTKKLYLIGPTGLAAGIRLPNTEIVKSTGSGLEKNWVIIVLTEDEGCALIAKEFEAGRYRGFFTTNLNLVNICLRVLKGAIRIEERYLIQ